MKKLMMILFGIVLFLALVVLPAITIYVYESVFSKRFETSFSQQQTVENYPGLEVKNCTFKTRGGVELAGYHYRREGDVKGVVVLSHGHGGGGQQGYMYLTDFFAKNGYAVFAYDATGNDNSPGEGTGGLPRGVQDLDYAIRHAKAEYPGMPIMLFGHSWGGYSVTNVLSFHPDVAAVACAAGFDRSIDMVIAEGKNMVGDAVKVMAPYVRVYEMLKFGKYAMVTGVKGIEKSDAQVLIFHSRDDDTVPFELGYGRFYAAHGDNERVQFVEFTRNGHGFVMCTPKSAGYRSVYGSSPRRDLSRYFELEADLMAQIIAMFDAAALK